MTTEDALPVVAHLFIDIRDGWQRATNACAAETLPGAEPLVKRSDALAALTLVQAERDAMQQERDELRALMDDALSICSSVSTDRSRRVVRDECVMYLQTEQWCKWLEDELAPKFHAALTSKATPTPEASEASRGR